MKQKIKEYKCPYCKETFICNKSKIIYHKRFCLQNPNYETNIKKFKEVYEIKHKKFLEEREKNLVNYELVCKKCGKIYYKSITKNDFENGKYSKYCSRSCANSHIRTNEQRKKVAENFKNTTRYKLAQIKRQEKLKYKLEHMYFCGSKELDEQNTEISKRQSPKYFNKFIPFGLDISKLWTIDFVDEYNKVKQLLYKEYVINGLSPKDIYNKYNCNKYFKNSETLLHVFKDMHFPIRSYKQAITNSWLQNKFDVAKAPQYKQQWHTTWNNKEVYLHSSYELDYARELDKQKIDYNVEEFRIKYFDTQKQEYRCAIPDFYIPNKNLIVEIKSKWTLDIQNMKDKFEEYKKLGYNCKLILDHNEVDLYTL